MQNGKVAVIHVHYPDAVGWDDYDTLVVSQDELNHILATNMYDGEEIFAVEVMETLQASITLAHHYTKEVIKVENSKCSCIFVEVGCKVVLDGVNYLVDIEIDDDLVYYTFINVDDDKQAPICRCQSIDDLKKDLFDECSNYVDNKSIFYYAAKLCVPNMKVHEISNTFYLKQWKRSFFEKVASGYFISSLHLKYNGNIISSAEFQWDGDQKRFKVA